ncbi:MAG: hypothetical protein V4594_00605 [Bacteroidota bacterium]
MKSINQYNNVEKARTLHQLFPNEMKAFIAFTKAHAENTIAQKEELARQWDSEPFQFDFWLTLAEEVIKKTKFYNGKLVTNSKLFAEQLFDGYLAIYTNNCFDLYAKQAECSNKFKQAITLFILP